MDLWTYQDVGGNLRRHQVNQPGRNRGFAAANRQEGLAAAVILNEYEGGREGETGEEMTEAVSIHVPEDADLVILPHVVHEDLAAVLEDAQDGSVKKDTVAKLATVVALLRELADEPLTGADVTLTGEQGETETSGGGVQANPDAN